MNNGATKKNPKTHTSYGENYTSSIRFLIVSSAVFSLVLTAYAFNAFSYFATSSSLSTEIQQAFDSSILRVTTSIFLTLFGLAYYLSQRKPHYSILLSSAAITFAALNACSKFDIATLGITLYIFSTLWCLAKLSHIQFVNSSFLVLAALSIGVIAIDLLNIAPSYPIAIETAKLNTLLSILFNGLFILCGLFNILVFSKQSTYSKQSTRNKQQPAKSTKATSSSYSTLASEKVADNLSDEIFCENSYLAIKKQLAMQTEIIDFLISVQVTGKVFGIFYYPQEDLVCYPAIDTSKYHYDTLQGLRDYCRRAFGQDSKIADLLLQAARTGENETLELAVHGEDRQPVLLKAIVKASKKGDIVEQVSVVLHDITETKRLTDELYIQASRDSLTGLLNRRFFEKYIEEEFQSAKNSGAQSAFLFIDLDRFKIVNDTSGHAAGDQLLKVIAEIVTSSIRSDDVPARLGGDEFGIILKNVTGEKAEELAETLRDSIEKLRFIWENTHHKIACSMGLVDIDPNIGNLIDIKQLADQACYHAKHSGRNQLVRVNNNITKLRRESDKEQWNLRIDEAFENNLFLLYCQSVEAENVDISASFKEVFVRMRDSLSGEEVSPTAFLPAAERFNSATKIDRWVIDRLVQYIRDNDSNIGKTMYWVNLCSATLVDKTFHSYLRELFENNLLPAGTINFEMDEHAASQNITASSQLIQVLRELGCGIAFDNFGNGMASLEILKSLPVDMVKLDQEFIRDIAEDKTKQIFAKSIIDVAQHLNIKTVAKIVESPNELQMVKTLGFDYLQGFAISQPEQLDVSSYEIQQVG